jgi:hypothetical protein
MLTPQSPRRRPAAPGRHDRPDDVVGIFPNPAALLRLSACVLIEADDEWHVDSPRGALLAASSEIVLIPTGDCCLPPDSWHDRYCPGRD